MTMSWPTGFGRFIGLLVILAAFVLAVVGQLDIKEAGLFIGCGLGLATI